MLAATLEPLIEQRGFAWEKHCAGNQPDREPRFHYTGQPTHLRFPLVALSPVGALVEA